MSIKLKKGIALLVAVLLVITITPTSIPTARAATEKKSGNYTYTVTDGSATIVDYYDPGGTIISTITIPSVLGAYPVTAIGDGAFFDCRSLKYVTIPSSVITIGARAFSFCTSLKKVIISDGVTTIGAEAFESCTSMHTVSIPDSVTAIGARAFYYCAALDNVVIPGSVTTLERLTFEQCLGLKSITIGNGVTTIGERAFYNCPALLSISLPESVTNIGTGAFKICTSLETVTILGSITTIQRETFYECSSLKRIAIPSSVTSIASTAFDYCYSLGRIDFGGSKTDHENIVGSVPVFASYEAGWCYAAEDFEDFSYTVLTDDKAVIQRYRGSTEEMVFPCEINGYTVVGVEDKAFYNTENLSEVYYTGTKKQWDSIAVNSGNTALTAARLHYGTNGEEHWDLTETVTPSECLSPGSGVFDCGCGYTANRQIAAKGHHYIALATVLPTCTEKGYTIYWCEDCDDMYESDYISSNGHHLIASIVVEPTCTMKGYTLYACKDCDYTVCDDYISATGHHHSVSTIVDATCTVGGYTEFQCENCDDSYREDIPVAHTFDNGVCIFCCEPIGDCLASAHKYANNTDQTWSVRQLHAEGLVLTFAAETALEDGYDFVYIYDGDGELVGSYTGTTLAGASVEVKGDMAVIRLVSDDSMVYYGFAVTDVKVWEDIPGDLNDDRQLDMRDAFALYTVVAGDGELNDAQKAVADMTGDGKYDMRDAFMLYRIVSGN